MLKNTGYVKYYIVLAQHDDKIGQRARHCVVVLSIVYFKAIIYNTFQVNGPFTLSNQYIVCPNVT